MSSKLRVGVAGPVGSGKTALVETLCIGLKKKYKIAVVTNDIYTKEDANFLIKKKILEEGRIVGVETGGCPHTAIREDCSLNKNAVMDLENKYDPLDFIFVESGGDNLAKKSQDIKPPIKEELIPKASARSDFTRCDIGYPSKVVII